MTLAAGIDVAEARKGLDIVALDAGRRVVFSHANETVSDMRDVVDRLTPDVVCIDSPPSWGQRGRTRSVKRERS